MKKVIGIILVVALVLVVLLFVTGTIYTVREDKQVILTQFGKPIGDPITDAGLHFKLPFIVKVNELEKRVLSWDGESAQMPTRDKTYIQVDTFARWEISEPLLYFKTLRDERSALSRLDDILGSETRNAVAKHDLLEVVRSTKDRKPARTDLQTENETYNISNVKKCVLLLRLLLPLLLNTAGFWFPDGDAIGLLSGSNTFEDRKISRRAVRDACSSSVDIFFPDDLRRDMPWSLIALPILKLCDGFNGAGASAD